MGKRTIVGVLLLAVFGGLVFRFLLSPVSQLSSPRTLEIVSGEGVVDIAQTLFHDGLIRSRFVFMVYVVLHGSSSALKPGTYALSPASSTPQIAAALVFGSNRQVRLTFPEGISSFEMDDILSASGVLQPGVFLKEVARRHLEGKLFPDTYDFFLNSPVEYVIKVFAQGFERKMQPLLPQESREAQRALIVASLLEKEVPTHEDQRIVAGIFEQRLRQGIPLQVDATVCYIKKVIGATDCYPLRSLDFSSPSPYNTYLYKGLPPGPIGNPGTAALRAALNPTPSPYLFYLTDPASKRTIFSKTFDEHRINRARYLFHR